MLCENRHEEAAERCRTVENRISEEEKSEYSNVDKTKFMKVDIRKFRSIQLKSNNPKILTPMPNTSSFHFDDNLDGNVTLIIDNPTKFWSVSNYLIIQL